MPRSRKVVTHWQYSFQRRMQIRRDAWCGCIGSLMVGCLFHTNQALWDVKVEASFCHVAEKWLHIDNTVFDDECRTVEMRVLYAVCESRICLVPVAGSCPITQGGLGIISHWMDHNDTFYSMKLTPIAHPTPIRQSIHSSDSGNFVGQIWLPLGESRTTIRQSSEPWPFLGSF